MASMPAKNHGHQMPKYARREIVVPVISWLARALELKMKAAKYIKRHRATFHGNVSIKRLYVVNILATDI